VKRFSHAIGFDDAPFAPAHRGDVLVVGRLNELSAKAAGCPGRAIGSMRGAGLFMTVSALENTASPSSSMVHGGRASGKSGKFPAPALLCCGAFGPAGGI
jgi:hypothetical protein